MTGVFFARLRSRWTVPLVLSGAAVVGISSTVNSATAQEKQEKRSAEVILGDSIYNGLARDGTCFTCHGVDGKGGNMGPDLTDAEVLHTDSTLASIIRVIEHGVAEPKQFPAPMPPFKDQFKAEEIKALAAYVKSLTPPKK
jgi:mono/diheme cytochrome c family protein